MYLRFNLIELWNWGNGPTFKLNSAFTIEKAKTILLYHRFTVSYLIPSSTTLIPSSVNPYNS